MHAVDVLVGIHLEQRGLVVDLRRRRVLHEHRVDGGIVVELADRSEQVVLRRVSGRCTCGEVKPTSAAFFCFMRM